jgi:hypothetical protein
MPDLTAKRTLVKSPPELWSELSEVERLARHLGAFGEIKITKLEPEHTVAWEGEGARGTVSIEPSGWGTKVTLTAQVEGDEAAQDAVAEEARPPEPAGAEAPSGSWPAEEPSIWRAPIEGEAEEEPPVAETAAWEEGVEEPVIEEPVIEEPVIEEPVEEPVVEEAAVEEAAVEEAAVEEAAVEEAAVEEAAVEEPAAEERPFEEPAPLPAQARPRRRRGFLAWLFKPRTSAQQAEPYVPAMPLEKSPPIPAQEWTAVVESEPDAGVEQGQPPIEEEPPAVAEEEPPAVAEEEPPAVVEEEPPAIAEEEPPALVEEEADLSLEDESPQVVEDQSPMVGEPDVSVHVAGDAESAGSGQGDGSHPGIGRDRAQAVLDGALDSLGSAHHRPFSRG